MYLLTGQPAVQAERKKPRLLNFPLARTLRAAPTGPRLSIRWLSRRSAPVQPAAAAVSRPRKHARVSVHR